MPAELAERFGTKQADVEATAKSLKKFGNRSNHVAAARNEIVELKS